MQPIIAGVLGKTTLIKGQIYNYEFEKSGSYEPTDPRTSFWNKFDSNKSLYLPTGTYKISVKGAFSLSEKDQNYNNNLEADIQITVD